ncbi:ATP-binding protein [Aureibaculum sp. 2210JD6-5]|uniref:tetratricopeptide repeat-containing sensor histidine kinase n=1 Tax=Aureibaculum sp. 2210JD6-5 TaxID=3103957 RepID=UPI002AAEF409|nr:ATP-binding protein [Aureibaculum sp. 2210JD6-5]MDY7394445.1 ATP-binding protein [Aureibaculum sp. 2210JD6-5]
MLPVQTQIAKYKIVLFIFCMLSGFWLYPQTDPLEKVIEINLQNKEYELALSNIEKLESNSKYLKSDSNKLNLHLLKAKFLYDTNQHERAINLLLKGFSELADNTSQKALYIKYAKYLGKIFNEAQNYNKSIEYYKEVLDNALVLKDTLNILDAYLSLGKNYYNKEVKDSAVISFTKMLGFPVTAKTENFISFSYNNLGIIASETDLELAEDYYNKSFEIKEKQKDTVGLATAVMNLGGIYYDKEEFVKAKENYYKAYQAVKRLKSERAVKVQEYALYNLAYTNEQLGDFEKAYSYLEEATYLTDSINEASVAENISEIEAKYNAAKQAQKIEEEKSLRLRAQFLFYGSALALLAFIILGYIFYRNYRLKQKSKIEQLENETQTRIINATIDAKEKERKSIAGILHDSVSALLSSANLHLQATKSQLKTGAPQEITKAQRIVNEASVKIRDLSHELISSVLLKFGLAFAVHDLCQKYSNSEITLRSDDKGIKRYDQDFEIKIYNIIEELINNILKHSKASNATIMLVHREDNMLSVRLSDDGIGFDIKTIKNKDGLGLSHINARVKVMNGIFNIVSSKGKGTSIFILVPIQLKSNGLRSII